MVEGVKVFGAYANLERCLLWGNGVHGVLLDNPGGLSLSACTIRDHAKGSGIYVRAPFVGLFSPISELTVAADCVFERNVWGDVVRDPEGNENYPYPDDYDSEGDYETP